MYKKKILYLMHIPWAWIKQRPHFFAEALSQDFYIKIVCKHPLKVKKDALLTKKPGSEEIKEFVQLPFEKFPIVRQIPFLQIINKLLINKLLSHWENYDYIWLTSIKLYPIVKQFINEKIIVIWDCMDDELEFEEVKKNPIAYRKYKQAESELINRANFIFCSSQYLSYKIQKRTNVVRDIEIVNNAIQLPNKIEEPFPLEIDKIINGINALPNVFMYIGCISEWFDFDMVTNLLEKMPTVHVVLVGPNDVKAAIHPRLIYVGTVERKWIFTLMKIATALIMPFKVTELIRSVNPVKLYEYIYANKPIIVPQYEESEKFAQYVYLYKTKEKFIDIALKIINKEIAAKQNSIGNNNFVLNNQWINRYQQIQKKLMF
jgi:hypothetical protein